MSIFDSNDTCECNAFSNPQNKDHVTILVDDSERTFPVVSSNVIFKPTTSEPKTIGLNGFGKRIGLSISKCRSENLFVVSANGRVYSASHYVNYLRPGCIAERVGFALGDLVLQVNRECVKGDLKLDELLDRNLEIKVISVARDKKSDHEIGCLSKNDPFLRRSEKEQMIRIEKVATDISFGFSLQRSSEKFGRRGQFRASLRVAQVLKSGPAERAGLKAGDLVEEVDGVNANSCGFEEMVQTIKSANESVHLLVIRPAISFGSTLSRLLTRLAIAKRHKDCNEDCSKDSCFLVHHHYEKISELEPDDRPVTEKRWNCSYERCKCSFTNIKELIRHYQAHSDEKPFECQICNRPSLWLFGKSSCWNARATDSKKRASPDASPSDSSPQSSQKPKWFISTDRKRYTCSFDGCKCSFVKSDELTKHYRVHTGDKPFECEVCHREFARSDHLDLHQKRHQNRDVSSVPSDSLPYIC